jgi:hypothetical protein
MVVLRIVGLIAAIFGGFGVVTLPGLMLPFAKDRGSRWTLAFDLAASTRNVTRQGRGLLVIYGLCWAGLMGGLVAVFLAR